MRRSELENIIDAARAEVHDGYIHLGHAALKLHLAEERLQLVADRLEKGEAVTD